MPPLRSVEQRNRAPVVTNVMPDKVSHFPGSGPSCLVYVA